MSSSLDVDFTAIGSTKLISWLKNLRREYQDDEDYNRVMSNVVNIGRISLTSAENLMSGNIPSLYEEVSIHFRDLIEKREDKMEHLTEILHNVKDTVQRFGLEMKTSSVKGKVTENIIQQILQNNVPEYNFDICAKKTASTDILAISEEEKTKGNKILIEIKNYGNNSSSSSSSSNVPKKEIEKFYRDINAHNPSGAIFISVSSKITGKNEFEISEYYLNNSQKIPIIFLYSNGVSISNIVPTFMLLTKIIHKTKDHNSSDVEKTKEKLLLEEKEFKKICQFAEEYYKENFLELENMSSQISGIRSNFMEMRKKIDKLLEDEYRKLFEYEIQYSSKIKSLKNKIKNMNISSEIENNFGMRMTELNKKSISNDEFVLVYPEEIYNYDEFEPTPTIILLSEVLEQIDLLLLAFNVTQKKMVIVKTNKKQTKIKNIIGELKYRPSNTQYYIRFMKNVAEIDNLMLSYPYETVTSGYINLNIPQNKKIAKEIMSELIKKNEKY